MRADNIATLSEQGRRELLAYGVKRVIDLRWIDERNEDPQVELGVEVLHLPLFGDHNERRETDRQLLERIPDHAECPARHVPRASRRVRRAVRHRRGGRRLRARGLRPRPLCSGASTAPGSSPHCCCASRRCSIDDVAADFALSRDNWAPHAPEWIEETEDEREREFRRFLAAMPGESMRGVLEELDRRYGGAESYLRAAGLPEADVHRIRARLRA